MSKAEQTRYGYLDSLRFFGAFIICTYHFLETRIESDAIRAILHSGIGTGAVVIFFIVSGYVMPFTVRRGVNLREFFTRRAFRLFPLYFAALAVIGVGGATGLIAQWRYMFDMSAWTWVANLLIIQDFVGARPFLGVSWTLAIEIIWYVMFFVALAVLKGRAALVLNILAPIAMLSLAAASLLMETRIPLGRPGMIYACAIGYQIYSYTKGDLSRASLLGWVALFIGVTTFTNFVSFGMFEHSHVALIPVLISWIGAPVVFTAVVLSPSLQQARFLNQGPLPAMGIMSYSIYLLHPIAVAISLQYFMPDWQLAAYIVFTAVLTVAGYRLVELPSLELGRRLTRGFVAPPGKLSPA